MAVFGEIIGGPVLIGLSAVTAYQAVQKPADPCKAPVFRIESQNLATLPGPHSAACRAAQQKPTAPKDVKTP